MSIEINKPSFVWQYTHNFILDHKRRSARYEVVGITSISPCDYVRF